VIVFSIEIPKNINQVLISFFGSVDFDFIYGGLGLVNDLDRGVQEYNWITSQPIIAPNLISNKFFYKIMYINFKFSNT
jgi:hypothetical protein